MHREGWIVNVFCIYRCGGWVSRRKMEKLKIAVPAMKGGYAGFRKAQLEPLLATLLEDPLLADVSKKEPTLQELETLIGVEKGSAMMLCIRKMDGTSFGIVLLTLYTPFPFVIDAKRN
jgi:hypothetical protein